jgi:pimeloyl-ACP methyl ester carboxylesterase
MTSLPSTSERTEVRIPPVGLDGFLDLPTTAAGLVVFAHGSGSSRLSPRNTHVARALHEAGLATLLFDLLTEDEAADRNKVFEIDLLAERLALVTAWAHDQEHLADLPIGYFGASTGAAAALVAAARDPEHVGAIVSRGGRPDMAGAALADVQAPTLLIVGSSDPEVLKLNRQALARLRCERSLEIVPGATHLFEEPGTLDRVVDLARHWFAQHLGVLPPPGGGARQP